jgi:protein involved in polysaccharide export with SLBB domain
MPARHSFDRTPGLRARFLRRLSFAVALATASLGWASDAVAQTAAATRAAGYSRADLQAALASAERSAGSSAASREEADILRMRLQNGDFSPGDRVVIEVRGDSALFDTLTVRTGPTLRLPNIPDVPLRGVLRSELQDHLTRYLARYIRDPDVRTESLIRLSVLGEVGKPGFYDFNSDMLLTDAIMAAGGPTGQAAVNRSTIKRGQRTVMSKGRVQAAAQSGATLDRIGLRPGDEITIGKRRERLNAQTILGIAGAAASLGLTILFFARN